MIRKSVLGIDLGTSAVKLLQRFSNGTVVKEKERYEEISPKGWWDAISRAMSRMELASVEAIGLSSQVGTYIIDDKEVISWNDPIGAEELAELKETYLQEEFLAEISMPHPNIISYPLPRLMYIKKTYPAFRKVCQPKDFICEKLTGKCMTDPYSWRGLANLNTKTYSKKLLKDMGIGEDMLPQMIDFTEVAGNTMKDVVLGSDLKEGVPVYVGCNDFFAGLLGMGMLRAGKMFDITGTSEHLGVITDWQPDLQTTLVHGPYFQHYALYGVTASSGASLDFGRSLYDLNDESLFSCIEKNPPIFMPYLNGERAPIWDVRASGGFLGITQETTAKELAYAVMEGVAFSLYHIYENMGCPEAEFITVAGGAAKNKVLCEIKATLFNLPVATLCESDTSAMGAQMLAAIGNGAYANLDEAIKNNCIQKMRILPNKTRVKKLRERFEIYKGLYPALKDSFHMFHESMR